MTDDNNRQQRSDVRTVRARWAYPSSAPSVVGRLTPRPASSVEIAAQDRHLEVIRPLVVFVVDEQHADEFVADIDLGGIVLLRPRHDADARIAAGSVLLKSVPNNVTVAGVPARVVGRAGCPEPSRTMDQMLYDEI